YHGPVVWVKDASRSVPVVSRLLADDQRDVLMAEVKADFDALRARHAAKSTERPLVSIEVAREKATPIDWSTYRPPVPHLVAAQEKELLRRQSGHRSPTVTQFVRTFTDYPIEELRDYIDWGPFFLAWEMKGRFPDILNNPATGEAASRLYEDAQRMLDSVIDEKWLRASGVFGLFPASSVGDDIEVYTDSSRETVATTLHTLRQQGQHRQGVPNRAMSDFVAPRDTGLADHVGAFAVTAGLGAQERVTQFKAENDDYSAILLESLADRLAEAFAERLHERVRHDFWGYAPDEHLPNPDLIAEKYVGIRPAPGYPACPDHTEKQLLWDLLDVQERTGIELTESMAMWPGAAVSGWYFSHPQSQYFVVGRLGRDQVEEYAERKGWTLREAERWLNPNLGYQPED
ncbi:MAG: vitamin B12 dependent-methionine synthase activation domain-containing protein, partial [Pedococcus sp.]